LSSIFFFFLLQCACANKTIDVRFLQHSRSGGFSTVPSSTPSDRLIRDRSRSPPTTRDRTKDDSTISAQHVSTTKLLDSVLNLPADTVTLALESLKSLSFPFRLSEESMVSETVAALACSGFNEILTGAVMENLAPPSRADKDFERLLVVTDDDSWTNGLGGRTIADDGKCSLCSHPIFFFEGDAVVLSGNIQVCSACKVALPDEVCNSRIEDFFHSLIPFFFSSFFPFSSMLLLASSTHHPPKICLSQILIAHYK
jgi:hypothetical protein